MPGPRRSRSEPDPISPELCLVDPELARTARARLPDPPALAELRPADEPRVRRLRAPRPATARRVPPAPAPAAPPCVPRRRTPRALGRVAVALAVLGTIAPALPSASVRGAAQVRAERPGSALTEPAGQPARPAAAGPRVLVVPDVCRLVYVFAKGLLQDAGFAWQLVGDVRGFAGNRIAWQSPPPGTVVVDTGAPTVTLVLERNPAYRERGTPEQTSPYAGTLLRFWEQAGAGLGAVLHPSAADTPVLNVCERGNGGDSPAAGRVS